MELGSLVAFAFGFLSELFEVSGSLGNGASKKSNFDSAGWLTADFNIEEDLKDNKEKRKMRTCQLCASRQRLEKSLIQFFSSSSLIFRVNFTESCERVPSRQEEPVFLSNKAASSLPTQFNSIEIIFLAFLEYSQYQ